MSLFNLEGSLPALLFGVLNQNMAYLCLQCYDDECSKVDPTPNNDTQPLLMFPHLVNLTSHPYGSVSVREIEQHYSSKIIAAYEKQAYDAFMDISLVVFAKSIERYSTRFKQAGVSFLPLVWADADLKVDWYSLIVNIPDTQVVVEIVSDRTPHNYIQDLLSCVTLLA